MAGKILHVDRDGRGLPGHPFCPSNTNLDHVCTKVWAGGFRNPFRFKLRPGGGLAVGDVGWNSREELDLIPTAAGGGGGLYGWPCYEGSTRTAGYRDRVECGDEYAKEGTPTAHVAPDYDYSHDGGSAAVLGGPTYRGTQYPAGYRDDVFFGDYALGFIRKANVDAQGRIVGIDDFASDWSGVDLEPDPSGDLAYASFGDGSSGSGSIRRIVYSPGNASPVAVASAAPTSGRSSARGVLHRLTFDGSRRRPAELRLGLRRRQRPQLASESRPSLHDERRLCRPAHGERRAGSERHGYGHHLGGRPPGGEHRFSRRRRRPREPGTRRVLAYASGGRRRA